MANKRIFYAVQQVGVSKCGAQTFTSIHGLQSVGMTTKFNLEQAFELGQLAIYQNIENIPDIEVTLEKVLDGYPLIYHLCTNGSTSPSLSGRSNVKATLGLSIYSDSQDASSGTPLAQCQVSGVFVSSLAYNFQVDGNSTEQVTCVANNKFWSTSFTATAFTNLDVPQATEGVNRRQHFLMGEQATSGVCKLPQDIPGISSSGYNPFDTVNQTFGTHMRSVKTSANLGREALYELGRKGPYHRYVSFPVQVQTDIEVTSTAGDNVAAYQDVDNLTNRTIYITTQEGTKIDLGSKNKLSSVTYGGANAGQQGGNNNATATYSFLTFNDMTVTHPQDPSGL